VSGKDLLQLSHLALEFLLSVCPKIFSLGILISEVEAEDPIISNVASATSTPSLARTLLSVVAGLDTLLLHGHLSMARAAMRSRDPANSNGTVAADPRPSFFLTGLSRKLPEHGECLGRRRYVAAHRRTSKL
jgi:hypothetical protein